MAETSISWTWKQRPDGLPLPGYTFNPWIGCEKITPACDGCYACQLMDNWLHRVKWGGDRQRTSAANWRKPLIWNRKAKAAGDRPFVFCASLADVFDNQVDPRWRADLFALIRECDSLEWLLLTKRPQNIIKMATAAGGLPPNAALGATTEDQIRANINVPHLLKAKAALNPLFVFVSCEPLLGPIDFERIETKEEDAELEINSLSGEFLVTNSDSPSAYADTLPRLDWIITGGETDQGEHMARVSHPAWFRDLRDQAKQYGVQFHHKQNGEFVPVEIGLAEFTSQKKEHLGERIARSDGTFSLIPDGDKIVVMRKLGKHETGRRIDGVEHNAYPATTMEAPANQT